MTNDKDGAALLREAIKRLQFNADFQRGYGSSDFRMYRDDADIILAALQSHGQAFDAAGVREACANVAEQLDMGQSWSTADTCTRFHTRNAIAAAIRALPIPEAPASVEPVAKVPAFATEEMVEAGLKTGSRYGATAMRNIWREMYMAAQSAHPEPDTIGSHFGNGGGLDPDAATGCADDRLPGSAEQWRAAVATPSPGFGGGDLREAAELAIADASYHLSKYRPHVLKALKAALAALPPVKQSVGEAMCRLSKFCDEWAKMRQRGDGIHGLHFGEERQADLRASDIRTVVAALQSHGHPQPKGPRS